jgi:CheY-like chemotaxis protein
MLGPIVQEAVRLIRAALPVNISLEFEAVAGVGAVLGDATQLQQVVMNLATNAIHAIGDDTGRIRIQLDMVTPGLAPSAAPDHAHATRMVRLRVTDTGHGMDEATISRLFEPFFTTKAVDEGTGLGLSVVHGIVLRHDGVISVESQPGDGATFTILFPAADESVEHEPPSSAEVKVAELPSAARAKRVLYLDDDEALALLVTRMLERRGYKVSAFTDQRAAIDALKAQPNEFSLFVTDYNMPGMSGIDVAREVGQLQPALPVAIVSGFIDEKLRAMAEEVGVKELIFKANVVEDFCEAVQRLLLMH